MSNLEGHMALVQSNINECLYRNYLVGSDRSNGLIAVLNLLLTMVDIYQEEFNLEQRIQSIGHLIEIVDSTKYQPVGDRYMNKFCHLIAQTCDIVSEPLWDDAWLEVIIRVPRSYLGELYVGVNPTVANCLVICA